MSAVFPETQESHKQLPGAGKPPRPGYADAKSHNQGFLDIKTSVMCRTNYPFKAQIVVLAKDFGMTLCSGAHTAVQIHALHTRDQTTQLLI